MFHIASFDSKNASLNNPPSLDVKDWLENFFFFFSFSFFWKTLDALATTPHHMSS
jgi:hypothetical protein